MADPASLHVLVQTALPVPVRETLAARHTLLDQSASAEARRHVRAVITNGKRGLSADEIATLPSLELVLTIGVGHENVDAAALKQRDARLVTARGTNEDAVADHALALLLASARELVQHDRQARGGPRLNGLPVSLTNKTIGILGLGEIGSRIARRAEAFGLKVAYHNRRRRDDVPYLYVDTPIELAGLSDFLVVSTPGGAETHHLVSDAVLDALGPSGRLINVGRGDVVDTAALARALAAGTIGGAALDVFEGEPHPPAALLEFNNVILTPHVASLSLERIGAMGAHLANALATHFQTSPSRQGEFA